jgi:hypothetical protein
MLAEPRALLYVYAACGRENGEARLRPSAGSKAALVGRRYFDFYLRRRDTQATTRSAIPIKMAQASMGETIQSMIRIEAIRAT